VPPRGPDAPAPRWSTSTTRKRLRSNSRRMPAWLPLPGPRGGTRHNTTARLIADLEAVREQLGIARWGVVGGSWGAALALA
ncbi:hypothetical protein QM312_35910, partial [Burkholderia cenocepacia]|uniref:alpha/beta fold hydrolase n=1 Tax=Burkholderia cenocepacia TaxID=95486 RepID=UPI003211C333|nr:hypothetical protein [Burkholderia cenocepacia]